MTKTCCSTGEMKLKETLEKLEDDVTVKTEMTIFIELLIIK